MTHGYAVIPPGLEAIVAAELAGLGVEGEVHPGGVRFQADAAKVAELARTMRTPAQVLLEVGSGSARSTDALGALVRRLPWKSLLHPQAVLRVEVSSRASALRFRENVSRSVGTMVREARKGAYIPDRGSRPKVEQVLQVRIVDDTATLSLDAGGELLHRRGWRTEAGKAPMRENLAACLLALAEWDGSDALFDPCCGSGTILIEGALLATGRPPFANRNFACDEWPAVTPAKGAARPRVGAPVGRAPAGRTPAGRAPAGGPPARPAPLPARVPIVGSDHHLPTVQTALQNAKRAGVSIRVEHRELEDIQPPAVVGTVVSNLPWGERLGEQVGGVYTTFGRVMRERFASWRVVFVTSDNRLAKRVDERVECLARFKNGGIPVGVWTFLA